MDLAQAARESGVIPPAQVGSLLIALSKLPDCSWLLTGPHPNEERLQGDLISEFPVAVVDKNGVAQCSKFAVLILNNTCDLQPARSDFLTVAPAMDFAKYSEFMIGSLGEAKASNHLRSVHENKVHEILWLPKFGPFGNGAVVFLNKVGAVSTKLYEDALQQGRRLASFSQNGFYFLLLKLTNHIARTETSDVTR
jgi:hypothetical protein